MPGDPHPPLAPLVGLLDLVGPANAAELLLQLVADLASCDATIVEALPRRDWLALRRASHNLTALAGTAGAVDLHHLAEALNQAAHASDLAAVQSLGPKIRRDLAALTTRINALSASRETR